MPKNSPRDLICPVSLPTMPSCPDADAGTSSLRRSPRPLPLSTKTKARVLSDPSLTQIPPWSDCASGLAPAQQLFHGGFWS